jgi:hypothetical protein
MTETTCTSTDPNNHQALHRRDTCPIHEQNDALVDAATWIVAEFDHYGETLQLGDGDDEGTYGPTSAIEQLRAALGTDWTAK